MVEQPAGFFSMFVGFVKIIKRHTPRVHGLIKRIHQRSGLPALKRLNGRFTLVAPNLLGTYPTEPHVLKWIDELLGPGDIFLDVGAHYGWMSMVACRSVGPTGKVIAFELAKFRPHAVKIDIEGAELLALQGSSSLLEERRATFIVAIHPSWLPQGQEAAEIFDLFRLHGYRVTASQTERYEGVDFGDYVFAPDRSAIH